MFTVASTVICWPLQELLMTLPSNLHTTVIASAVWMLAVVFICLFARHRMAVFATDGLQAAIFEIKRPV
jgi:hypothetical protein